MSSNDFPEKLDILPNKTLSQMNTPAPYQKFDEYRLISLNQAMTSMTSITNTPAILEK